MVVKSKKGRRRYVVFEVDPAYTRQSFINFLNHNYTNEDIPYIVQCGEGLVVLRCTPKNVDQLITFMNSIGSKSLLTSGTLRKLRAKFSILKETKPPNTGNTI